MNSRPPQLEPAEFRVERHGKDWAVTTVGRTRPLSVHASREDAEILATRLAVRARARVVTVATNA